MALVDREGKEFPKLHNDCILRAARGEQTEYVPVWIMRQAGRYLPEFRELRSKHSFFECCETPKLASEITLMPIRRFNLDAAIIFSDILVIPQALGLQVDMTPEGPKFPAPLVQGECLEKRLKFDVDIAQRLHYIYEAISLTRHALMGRCPLIGFSGAPWTLMCYMIEGGGSKTMSKAKKYLYQDKAASRKLLALLTEKVTDHLVEQIRAGVQLVQIFESNAEYLTEDLFLTHTFKPIIDICKNLSKRLKNLKLPQVPIFVFAKGGHHLVEHFKQHDDIINVISLDWTMDPKLIRPLTGNRFCLQGNLDPCALYADVNSIEKKVESMLKKFGTHNYIANLGHGIYPDADPKHVEHFIDCVHKISREMNKFN